MILDEEIPGRRPWLITLADLALLLVGFFVYLKASEADPRMLAARIRAGFVEARASAMPVDIAAVGGFATGSAEIVDASAALDWARSAARDPRTRLHVTGEVDGTPGDVDPLTGSGPILAADRARAVAARLVRGGAVSPDRILLSTARGRRRAVLTLGYDGGGKHLPPGNRPLPPRSLP